MLTVLLYPLLHQSYTGLAVTEGHTTCVGRLLFTPGIDKNIKDDVTSYTFMDFILP